MDLNLKPRKDSRRDPQQEPQQLQKFIESINNTYIPTDHFINEFKMLTLDQNTIYYIIGDLHTDVISFLYNLYNIVKNDSQDQVNIFQNNDDILKKITSLYNNYSNSSKTNSIIKLGEHPNYPKKEHFITDYIEIVDLLKDNYKKINDNIILNFPKNSQIILLGDSFNNIQIRTECTCEMIRKFNICNKYMNDLLLYFINNLLEKQYLLYIYGNNDIKIKYEPFNKPLNDGGGYSNTYSYRKRRREYDFKEGKYNGETYIEKNNTWTFKCNQSNNTFTEEDKKNQLYESKYNYELLKKIYENAYYYAKNNKIYLSHAGVLIYKSTLIHTSTLIDDINDIYEEIITGNANYSPRLDALKKGQFKYIFEQIEKTGETYDFVNITVPFQIIGHIEGITVLNEKITSFDKNKEDQEFTLSDNLPNINIDIKNKYKLQILYEQMKSKCYSIDTLFTFKNIINMKQLYTYHYIKIYNNTINAYYGVAQENKKGGRINEYEDEELKVKKFKINKDIKTKDNINNDENIYMKVNNDDEDFYNYLNNIHIFIENYKDLLGVLPYIRYDFYLLLLYCIIYCPLIIQKLNERNNITNIIIILLYIQLFTNGKYKEELKNIFDEIINNNIITNISILSQKEELKYLLNILLQFSSNKDLLNVNDHIKFIDNIDNIKKLIYN